MCVSVCVCGVEGGGLGVEEVKEPKPQNMIREKESVLYADEGKKKGVLYAGSTIVWVVPGVERSMGCCDRLICVEGGVRAGLLGAAHWLDSFCLRNETSSNLCFQEFFCLVCEA